jgi:hypothetical protein
MNRLLLLAVLVVIGLLVWVWLRRSANPAPPRLHRPEYASLEEEMVALASQALGLARRTYHMNLDFAPDSVQQVEELSGLMHEEYNRRKTEGEKPAELAEDVRAKAVIWGSYVGEVARRLRGGRWQRDSALGENTFSLEAEDTTIFPFTWVHNRITNGEEDNVWHKFQVSMMRDKLKVLTLEDLQRLAKEEDSKG